MYLLGALAFSSLGCGLRPPVAGSDSDSAAPPDTADIAPAIPLDCTSVIGTNSIAIASRSDLSTLLTTAPPTNGELAATTLAGPDRGDLPRADVRIGALDLLAPVLVAPVPVAPVLVAPVLVALPHQEQLDGARCRPLDMDAFCSEHLRRWLLAWS